MTGGLSQALNARPLAAGLAEAETPAVAQF